jgi:hypothetical protein
MPRHPAHAGEPYKIPVVVKMNPEGIKVLDRLRGSTPRGTYLRGLLKAELRRTKESE